MLIEKMTENGEILPFGNPIHHKNHSPIIRHFTPLDTHGRFSQSLFMI